MVRVGVVGTSWWADAMYLPALKNHPQAEVVAVCGRDYARLQAFARQWDIPCTYTEYQKMIFSGDLDALIIATTNDTHYPIAMLALDANLHILCDKPLAQTPAQAQEMAAAARARGLKTLVPFTYRYMPAIRYVKQLIDDGYIGRPYHLNMRYYAGFGRDAKYTWRFDADVTGGAGVVGDLGSHWLHLARMFYGEIDAISCYVDTMIDRPDKNPLGYAYTPADDTAIMTVHFVNGAYGSLHVTTLAHEGTPFGQTHHMEFHGSDGTLYHYCDWDRVQEVRGVKPGSGPEVLTIPDAIWNGARREVVHDTYRDVFREQDHMTREFITAIAEGKTLGPDFDEGARVQQLIAAAVESARSRCWVDV